MIYIKLVEILLTLNNNEYSDSLFRPEEVPDEDMFKKNCFRCGRVLPVDGDVRCLLLACTM